MTLILHLEDDGPLRDILKVAITAAQPDVVFEQFVGSDEALAFIETHLDEIDIFVLDIRVPGALNGLEVAEKIRQLGADHPIIITSAFRRPAAQTLDMLKCQWLQKPMYILDAHKAILPLLKGKKSKRIAT